MSLIGTKRQQPENAGVHSGRSSSSLELNHTKIKQETKSERALKIGRKETYLEIPKSIPKEFKEMFLRMEDASKIHYKRKISEWGTFSTKHPQIICSGCSSRSYYYCNCCPRNRNTVFCHNGPCYAEHVARSCVDIGINYLRELSENRS